MNRKSLVLICVVTSPFLLILRRFAVSLTLCHMSRLPVPAPGHCPMAPGPADFLPLCRLEGERANEYLCGLFLFRP